jgi:hypothetical protein
MTLQQMLGATKQTSNKQQTNNEQIKLAGSVGVW